MSANQLELPINVPRISPKSFRPIHYLGSKLRIVDFIEDVINYTDPSMGPVCDLFAGSGSVTYTLAKSRNVKAVDIQEYSRVICSAILNPSEYPENIDNFIDECRGSKHRRIIEWAAEPIVTYEISCIEKAINGEAEPLSELLERGSLIAYESKENIDYSKELETALKHTLSRLESMNLLDNPGAMTLRYFGGLYFSYLQSVHLDILLEMVFEQYAGYRDMLLAPLLSTASDIVNTVGKQFAQPIKPRRKNGSPKLNLGQRISQDRNLDVFSSYENWLQRYSSIDKSIENHEVYRLDYLEALDQIGNSVNVIYADPPYTRDHYSRYYHVLETLCLRDNPKVTKIRIDGKEKLSRGIYREERYQSPFCIKSQAEEAFDALFSKARGFETPVVLSYSPYNENKKARPRVLTVDRVMNIANKYYSKVHIVSPGKFSHSKLNSSEKNFEMTYQSELLIVCEIN